MTTYKERLGRFVVDRAAGGEPMIGPAPVRSTAWTKGLGK